MHRSADLPSRGQKETAASPTSEGVNTVTPQAKEPEQADALSPSVHSLPTGLAAIADAAEHASPFSSELEVLQRAQLPWLSNIPNLDVYRKGEAQHGKCQFILSMTICLPGICWRHCVRQILPGVECPDAGRCSP